MRHKRLLGKKKVTDNHDQGKKMFKKKQNKKTQSDREAESRYVIVPLKHQSGAGEGSIVGENKRGM